mgnify:FL=1|tara:strand:+ start:197 stop:298 length:102 start_codon:yes stop_codon:yes gene_type:complete
MAFWLQEQVTKIPQVQYDAKMQELKAELRKLWV